MPKKRPAPSIHCLVLSIILLLILINPVFAQIPYSIPIQILRPPRSINIAKPVVIPQEILLKFKIGTPENQIWALYTKYGLREVSFSPYSGIRRCYVLGPIPSAQLVALLRAEPPILWTESNWVGRINAIPNDPLFVYQWHLGAMNMDLAWDISTGSGVIVAVLDTGVACENFDIYALAPDLAATSFVPGYDFVNDDPNPDDDEGHGTHITGTIAQSTNNLLGGAGGAFGATIMPVKVMDNAGNGTLTDIVDGIYFAVNNGAYILNLSLGFGDNPTVALEEAVNYAADNGCLLICSAGNYGTNLPNYPGAYPSCVSVSGVRFDGTLGDYSNYGSYIDLCAPGGDLNVDQNLDGYPDGILQQTHDGSNFQNFGYFMGRGTSWAAANASAVAALVVSVGGGVLTATEVRSILESTARDLGTVGWDEYYGWGMVDAFAAVNAAVTAINSAQTLGTRIALTSQFLAASSLPVVPVLSLPVVPGILETTLSGIQQQSQNFIATINGITQRTSQINQSETFPSGSMARISGLTDLWQLFPSPGSAFFPINTLVPSPVSRSLNSFMSPLSYFTEYPGLTDHNNYPYNASLLPSLLSQVFFFPFF